MWILHLWGKYNQPVTQGRHNPTCPAHYVTSCKARFQSITKEKQKGKDDPSAEGSSVS